MADKYRKRPIEVEAMLLTDNCTEVKEWIDANGGYCFLSSDQEGAIAIYTAEGEMSAVPGDYVIREPFATDDRKFYPCKPDIFEQTYEAVSNG